MNNYLLLFIFIFFLVGCRSMSDKDITVIDGVKLGVSLDKFEGELDSLGVKKLTFYTKDFLDAKDADYNQMNTYVTDIFNSSEFSSKEVKHYGIYYPINLNGTKNIVGVNILLVHTDDALDFSGGGLLNLSKLTSLPAVNQNISTEQIDDIAKMLCNKYGNPDTFKIPMTNFYVIEESEIKQYHGNETSNGNLLTWKTKYLTIKFFEGILSSDCQYNSYKKTYWYSFDKNSNRQVDYSKGERYSNTFSYINYTLNDETVKNLNLDKAAL